MSPRKTGVRLSRVPTELGERQPGVRLTWLDKLMVQHAHPPKLILDTVAYMWGLYCFWHHELVAGLVVLFGIGGLGTVLAFRKDMAALARTSLGRLLLVSSHPANMLLQVVGYIVIAYGVWIHSTPTVLTGATSVLLGHLFGWPRYERVS